MAFFIFNLFKTKDDKTIIAGQTVDHGKAVHWAKEKAAKPCTVKYDEYGVIVNGADGTKYSTAPKYALHSANKATGKFNHKLDDDYVKTPYNGEGIPE